MKTVNRTEALHHLRNPSANPDRHTEVLKQVAEEIEALWYVADAIGYTANYDNDHSPRDDNQK